MAEQTANAAGEIEARDTATRRNLTAEERKKTPPDLGDEKTVFADRPSASWMKESNQNGEQSGIKDQLRAAQGTLDDMQPVAVVSVPVVRNRTMREARAWVVDQLKNTGYAVERASFGRIIFDPKRLNTSLDYIETDAEVAAFAALPRVLKRGVEISSHGNHKGRDYATVTFAAPVVINGKRGNMAVVVKRTNGNYYKMHRILMPDGSTYVLEDSKNAEPTPERGLTQMSTHANPISSASDTRVPQTGQTVKTESAEDGRKDSLQVSS